MQIPTLESDGTSYIVSIMTDSMIARSPLAPVFLSTAIWAISWTASGVNSSFTSSSSNNFWYCFTRAFFGSVRIRTRASSSRRSKDTITGTLPTNSGIRPNFVRSCGIACFNSLLISVFFLSTIFAPKPMELVSSLDSMIRSRPSKAPPQMNRMFVVSIWISSCCGCFLPP